jgi:tetratricopeptide (TPR) repeat protein
MFARSLLAAAVLGLAGCAASPPAPTVAQLPWHDDLFGYDTARVEATHSSLFVLDPELRRTLQQRTTQGLSPRQQMTYLLDLLFGTKRERFQYAAGHTTGAAETWQRKRGDCLSLAILTFAAARELHMSALMQEVDVPVLYDRRGDLDFVNRHVNVRFSRPRQIEERGWAAPQDVVVDFEPEFGSTRVGRTLEERGIVARFYNNIATEFLADGDKHQAYTFFKAAILAEPAYAAAYINLAVLYRNAGLARDAEQLLADAVALSDRTEVILPLHALQVLMQTQGRDAEAQHYAHLLQSARESDPYYWISLGLEQLKAGQFPAAVESLEHASDMVSGFPELHQYLAVAYWRSGNKRRADEQMALLESMGDGAAATGLRTKFNSNVH